MSPGLSFRQSIREYRCKRVVSYSPPSHNGPKGVSKVYIRNDGKENGNYCISKGPTTA